MDKIMKLFSVTGAEILSMSVSYLIQRFKNRNILSHMTRKKNSVVVSFHGSYSDQGHQRTRRYKRRKIVLGSGTTKINKNQHVLFT